MSLVSRHQKVEVIYYVDESHLNASELPVRRLVAWLDITPNKIALQLLLEAYDVLQKLS